LRRNHTREFKLQCCRQSQPPRSARLRSAASTTSQRACCCVGGASTRHVEKRPSQTSSSQREKLCELFGVSRSWYYEKPSSQQKASEDVELRDAIERIVMEFSGYGYRRVTESLRRQGWRINHKKIAQGDDRGVAFMPTQATLQADHRLGALPEELPESHQRGSSG
jgi:hypothetical protein